MNDFKIYGSSLIRMTSDGSYNAVHVIRFSATWHMKWAHSPLSDSHYISDDNKFVNCNNVDVFFSVNSCDIRNLFW